MINHYIIKIEEIKDSILFQSHYLVNLSEDVTEPEDVAIIMSNILMNLYGEGSGTYIDEEEVVSFENGIKAKLIYDAISEEEFGIFEKYLTII